MLDDSSNRLIWIAVGLALIFGIFETYNGTIPKILESVTSTTQASIPVEHTAYAYSADGTDRFSTINPNLNLMNFKTNLTVGKYLDWLSGVKMTNNVSRATFDYISVIPEKTYTINSDWDKTSAFSIFAFTDKTDAQATYIYDGPSNKWMSLSISRFVNRKTTFTIPEGIHYIRMSYLSVNGTNTLTLNDLLNSETKLEEGSTATTWMPSASEVQDSDYPTYVGTYTDHNQSASNDPTKYSWKKR